MKAFLYIGTEKIGEVHFSIIDESMGGIGGNLIANDNYKKYQPTIQRHFEKKGISNVDNFNFRILLEDNTELKPEGGIGVTDSVDFDEIYVESAGIDLSRLQNKDGEKKHLSASFLAKILLGSHAFLQSISFSFILLSYTKIKK